MIIASNATYSTFASQYSAANNKLQASMSRLSSGQRINAPGDAPADLGISERFRAQIRNVDQAGQVMQNAVNIMQTTDTWMQEVHNILDRMSELSISAADGSKSQADRQNLDLEFQQLKAEVVRISEAGKYNGLQINGRTAVATYDTLKHQIEYTQPDGSDVRSLGINFRDGCTAANGIKYAFESSAANGSVGDYIFTADGKSLIYVAQKSVGTLSAQKTLMKLDIESNTLSTVQLASAGGLSATNQARLAMDEQGRIWVSNPSTNAGVSTKHYNLQLLDVDSMTLDAGGTGATNAWSGGVSMASSFSNFSVYNNYAFFIERSGAAGHLSLVKQNIFDTSDKTILLNDLSGMYGIDKGETYAISADGQYLAFEDESNASKGMLNVINTATGEKAALQVGTTTNSVTAIGFDANDNIFWTDTGGAADANAIKRAQIVFGEKPEIADIQLIRQDTAGRLGSYNSAMAGRSLGLSVAGGSPAGSYTFQVGADGGMTVDFVTADVRATKLGISDLNVLTQTAAAAAVNSIAKAVDQVSNQRAILGAQVSRMNFAFEANTGYRGNLSSAESRIRDVDIATETTKMTEAQILTQASLSVLTQANSSRSNILRLLQ